MIRVNAIDLNDARKVGLQRVEINRLGGLAQTNLSGGHEGRAFIGFVGQGLLGLEAELAGRYRFVELGDLPRAIVRIPRSLGALNPLFISAVAIPDGVLLDETIGSLLTGQIPQGFNTRRLLERHVNIELILRSAAPQRVVDGVVIAIKGELDRAFLAALPLLVRCRGRHVPNGVVARIIIGPKVRRNRVGAKVDDKLTGLGVVLGLEQDLDLVLISGKDGDRGIVLASSGDVGHNGARVIAARGKSTRRQIFTIHVEALEHSFGSHRVGSGRLDKFDLGNHSAGLVAARVGCGRVHNVHANEHGRDRFKVIGVEPDVGACVGLGNRLASLDLLPRSLATVLGHLERDGIRIGIPAGPPIPAKVHLDLTERLLSCIVKGQL